MLSTRAAIEAKDKRIAELEAENAQCKEAFAVVSAGKPMGPIVEGHLIANMQRHIAELEAENERLFNVCVEFEHRASEERIQQSNRNAEHHEKIMKQAIEWKKNAERYQIAIGAEMLSDIQVKSIDAAMEGE